MMSETKSTYWLSRFTVQSRRQRVAQSHRLAAHPTTEISMSPNNWFPGRGRPSDYARLIPDPASWEFYDRDLNPRNWPVKKKVLATTMVAQISWLVQFASAVDASNTAGLEEKFNVGSYISSLATGKSSPLDFSPSKASSRLSLTSLSSSSSSSSKNSSVSHWFRFWCSLRGSPL